MYANGFFEEKRRSPLGLATVVTLHAAALGAVVMFGTTTFIRPEVTPIHVYPVPIPPDPPIVEPPENNQQTPRTEPRSRPTTENTPLTNNTNPIGSNDPPVPPSTGTPGPDIIDPPVAADPLPVVRVGAQVNPGTLQPPYPASEERAQRTGQVRVRVTIGVDGRVTAIQRVSATNDAFWRVTERQALSRWRFRPATENGRPVVSTMVFTVTFRLPEE